MAARQCSSAMGRWTDSAPSSATLRLRLLRRLDSGTMSGGKSTPSPRSCCRLFSTWVGARTTRKSAWPSGIIGEWTDGPKRTSDVTDPPRWLIPWISAFFTSWPARKAASASTSEALMTPCPPRPAKTTFVTSPGIVAPAGRARGGGGRGGLLGVRLLEVADVRGGEDAGAPRHDHREVVRGQPPRQQLREALRVLHRVDDVDVPHPRG